MEDNMQIMIRMIVRSIQTYLRPQVSKTCLDWIQIIMKLGTRLVMHIFNYHDSNPYCFLHEIPLMALWSLWHTLKNNSHTIILSQEKQINNVKVFQKINHVSKKPEWDMYTLHQQKFI